MGGASVGSASMSPEMAAKMGIRTGGAPQHSPLEFNIPADMVLLPSQGLHYAHGKTSVLMQDMTSSEENILRDQVRIQNYAQWNDLLGVLIRDEEFLPPGNMLPADFSRCLLHARINGYGDEYEVQVMDPFTSKLLIAPYNKVNLSDVKNKPLTHRPDADGLFSFHLERSNLNVRFRLLSNDEYMVLLRMNENDSSQSVTNRLYRQVVEVDGNKDRRHIEQLSRGLPALDSMKLRLYMDEVEPALDTTMKFVSSVTGNPTFQRAVSLNDSIFYF